jgi:hypothetical protein
MKECPDCGATEINIFGFACDHEKCPVFRCDCIMCIAEGDNSPQRQRPNIGLGWVRQQFPAAFEDDGLF